MRTISEIHANIAHLHQRMQRALVEMIASVHHEDAAILNAAYDHELRRAAENAGPILEPSSTWIDRNAALHPFPEQVALRRASVHLFAPATDEDADKLARLFGVLTAASTALSADDMGSPVLQDVIAALAQAGFGKGIGNR